jgi:hypothetical protein
MAISGSALVGLFLLGVLIGRAAQNWCNRTGEAERLAYRAGYQDGEDGREPEM